MGKLAPILAFVLVMAGVDAQAGDSVERFSYGSVSEAPAKKNCPTTAPEGGKAVLQYPVYCRENSKSVTKEETQPRNSEPRSVKGAPRENAKPAPAEAAKAQNPTKKAAPDPSEHAEKAGQ